jgi:hypothetical protein
LKVPPTPSYDPVDLALVILAAPTEIGVEAESAKRRCSRSKRLLQKIRA